jgi:hypothetical protein
MYFSENEQRITGNPNVNVDHYDILEPFVALYSTLPAWEIATTFKVHSKTVDIESSSSVAAACLCLQIQMQEAVADLDESMDSPYQKKWLHAPSMLVCACSSRTNVTVWQRS